MITLPSGKPGEDRDLQLYAFAAEIKRIASMFGGDKYSSRGWAYILEGMNVITKDQFDRAQGIINECRAKGLLPIDFVAEEDARAFEGVEEPSTNRPIDYIEYAVQQIVDIQNRFIPNWWRDEKYYIQMLVEKIDLKTLFGPICAEYHIPIATSKGWSSMLQRAEYARRFKEAEDHGLECVLLYCGDHDPSGLLISNKIRDNLMDLKDVEWEDGTDGYDPSDLIIDRFGLNYDFIIRNKLTWINNLVTGSGKDLADPRHQMYGRPFVQKYLARFGARKCEANALLRERESGQQLCRDAIEKYLGEDARNRFAKRRADINGAFKTERDAIIMNDMNLEEYAEVALEAVRKRDRDTEGAEEPWR